MRQLLDSNWTKTTRRPPRITSELDQNPFRGSMIRVKTFFLSPSRGLARSVFKGNGKNMFPLPKPVEISPAFEISE